MNFLRRILGMFPKTILISCTLILILGLFITACGGTASHFESQAYQLAPISDMPIEVQTAPKVVQNAYQFAVANPDVLNQLPCYCGCGDMGHSSNYACYVAGEEPVGTLLFDGHALGCSICVDITVDARRMLDDGQSIAEIRTFIDQTYSAFGPSNMP
jgi:hypothetical protein